MGLKSIFSALFSFANKPNTDKEPVDPVAEAETKQELVSPYAKYMQAEHSLPRKPQGHETEKAHVFTSTDTTGTGTVRKVGKRPKVKAKDVFLLDSVSANSSVAPDATPVDTVGLFFPEQGALLIRDPNKGKAGRLIRWEENTGHQPLFGDWQGDGNSSLGFFDPKNAFFYLWFKEENRESDLRFLFGPPGFGWLPLVGDWDGDGKDGIGLYDPASSTFVLRNELSGGEPDIHFMYGPPGLGWIPLAGDWDGDGKDGVGVYDPLNGLFLLRNELSGGNHDISFRIPEVSPDWIPLVGDWDGDGADSVGIYDPRDRTFYLCNQSFENNKDLVFRFGPVGVAGIPIVLRWAGD
ncbi:hypothetical protein [Methylomagnum sp.]